FVQRADKLQVREARAFGKDLYQRSFSSNGDYVTIAHSGIANIDILVFFKIFFQDIRSKKLKSLLEHFYSNKENVKLRETLNKEHDALHHSDPLIRQFCQLLPAHFLINNKQDVHF